MKISVEFNKFKYICLVAFSLIFIIISLIFEEYGVLVFPIGILIFVFIKVINYLSYNMVLNEENISIYSYLSLEDNEIKHETINLKDIDRVEIKRLLILKDINNKVKFNETYSNNGKPYLYLYIKDEVKKVELHKYTSLQIERIKTYFINKNKIDVSSQIENEYYSLKNDFSNLSIKHIDCNDRRYGNGINNFIVIIFMLILSLILGVIEIIKEDTIILLSSSLFYLIFAIDLLLDRKKEKNKLYDYYNKLILMKENNKELLKESFVSIEDYFEFLIDDGFILNKTKEKNKNIFEYKLENNTIKIISKNTFFFDRINIFINDKEIIEYNKSKDFIKEYKKSKYYSRIYLIRNDLKLNLLDYIEV